VQLVTIGTVGPGGKKKESRVVFHWEKLTEIVKGYEDLSACRAAAIVQEFGRAVLARAELAGEWRRRYPCGGGCGCEVATGCATEGRIAKGLAVLETLAAARVTLDLIVPVNSDVLQHLADNLAIMEADRVPVPRAQWRTPPYVPRSLRPVQGALGSLHAPLRRD
jgi:hypothetical protein